MLPGGVLAAGFLLALVPGWLFLRLTESSRRPRNLSSLQEVLELVAIGLLTTGLSTGVVALLAPEILLGLGARRPTTVEQVRELTLTAILLLASAMLVAWFAANWVIWRDPVPESSVKIGVWWDALAADRIPRGTIPYVALRLSTGETVEGILMSYTWSPDVEHRDIAIRSPIKVVTDGKVKEPPYDVFVVPGAEVKHIAVKFVPQ